MCYIQKHKFKKYLSAKVVPPLAGYRDSSVFTHKKRTFRKIILQFQNRRSIIYMTVSFGTVTLTKAAKYGEGRLK